MEFVAVVAAGMALLSCRQVLGFDDYHSADSGVLAVSTPADATPTACGLPFGSAACVSCASVNCCAESSACAADQLCSPYETCLGKCSGDPACRSQCTIDHPAGTVSTVSALSACLAARCEIECGLPCGGVANLISPPDTAAACQDCLTTNACDHARSCGTSAECDAFWRCYMACPFEFDCRQECANGHESAPWLTMLDHGIRDEVPFWPDWSGTCASSCAYGGYWSCVGNVSWPSPKSPDSTFTLIAYDAINTNLPLTGVDVSVCTGIDLPCAQPVAHGTTDSNGIVTLPVQNTRDSFGLGLNGYFQLDPGGRMIYPSLLYWEWPISEASYAQQSAFGTKAETQQLAAAAGVTLDAKHGTIIAVAFDCFGNEAPGVQVSTNLDDAGVQRFYGYSFSTAVTATDQTGTVFFSHVPAGGAVELTAVPMAIGRASSVVTIPSVRAGTNTELNMMPTPSKP